MEASSCTFQPQIPNPPTNLASCAVPIGGSNSSILDVCCNGHINAISTYAAPNEGNDCYQYCITPNPTTVKECLDKKLSEYGQGQPQFQCFNTVGLEQAKAEDEYESAATSIKVNWVLGLVMGIGFVGSFISAV